MSERRAILEKDIAQADLNSLPGRADMAEGMSEVTSCRYCAGVNADLPGTYEIWRNDTINRLQGTRNQFIDAPALADNL